MPALSFLSVTGLLALFHVYTGGSGWEIKQEIPFIFAAYLTIYMLIFLVRKAKQKGLNVIAYSLIAAGLLCICTEGILSVYLRTGLFFGWSLIVMVSLSFIAMLLLFIHFRLKKATDLKRFFHI